jgi:aconitate hydratase A / 2-methylisocitrate dehydratase
MNSFDARSELSFGGQTYTIYRLDALDKKGFDTRKLPYSLRILLENLLRTEDGKSTFPEQIEALAGWDPKKEPDQEIAFTPARVLLQDFTGVPCVVDLAAMRGAVTTLGGNPDKINPLQPVELVIDHSVQVDQFGTEAALLINRDLEFERNIERYEFLKWGQAALQNFRVVPPNTGIVHQVNLEHLARVVFVKDENGSKVAYPDTLVGTDSHTTMINGLGVLGWGVGGIEAEAAMLGQPVSMLIPQVIGFKLSGKLSEGVTATDLVLTVTEMLRKKGVVGKFVEFFGPGLASMPLADRATIGNMAPEYGATCGIFPVDAETLNYMRLTGRSEDQVGLVEAYCRTQGLFHDENTAEATYTDTLELNLAEVKPSVAGPKRPQDRLLLPEVGPNFSKTFADQFGSGLMAKISHAVSNIAKHLKEEISEVEKGMAIDNLGGVATLDVDEHATDPVAEANEAAGDLAHGSVVIAAITSCTNTSNPSVMLAAGLVAKKAVELGLKRKPWVKSSLAPGSRVAGAIIKEAGLQNYLNQLGFNIVGYGCTTCIGNSGPLPPDISKAITDENLVVASVLSGNRNFEGRINQDVKANYLMSPPLVVAYSLAGTINIDLEKDPLGHDDHGKPIYLRDIWPSQQEISDAIARGVKRSLFDENYKDVFKGDEKWQAIAVEGSKTFAWKDDSTYVKNPPYFDGMSAAAPASVSELKGMRVLAVLGDSVTTDHISPAGSIKLNSPAGAYLTNHGVSAAMFNSYGSRRGNHEVMVRGTFANVRLRNQLAPGTEGGFTTYLPTDEVTTIYEASMQYQADRVPLLVLAGKEYGSGSSRDWAAKGPFLLGIKAVIAQSFERIHRSNLVGMGILPCEFMPGESVSSLGLTGKETFGIAGLSDAVASGFSDGKVLKVIADGKEFQVKVRIDTPQEVQYYVHGGILQYVLRSLL